MSARSETGAVAVPPSPVVVGAVTSVTGGRLAVELQEAIRRTSSLREQIKQTAKTIEQTLKSVENSGVLSLTDFQSLQGRAIAQAAQITNLLTDIKAELTRTKEMAMQEKSLRVLTMPLSKEACSLVSLRADLANKTQLLFASQVEPRVKADLRAMERA